MQERSRRNKALLFSAFVHVVALLCWGWIAATENERLPPENIIEVTLLEESAENIVSEQLSASAQVQRKEMATAAAERPAKRPSAAAGQSGKAVVANGDTANDGAAGNGVAGTTGLGGGDAVSEAETTAASPAKGSMGYSKVELLAVVEPVYPDSERRNAAGVHHVRIRILVLADGSIGSCEVESSSGRAALERAALAAARQYRFAPSRDLATGEAVAGELVVPFRFDLQAAAPEEDLW